MKGIRDIRVIFIVAVLVVATACGESASVSQQTADPADAIPAQTEAQTEPDSIAYDPRDSDSNADQPPNRPPSSRRPSKVTTSPSSKVFPSSSGTHC